jgi:hypothetical protein
MEVFTNTIDHSYKHQFHMLEYEEHLKNKQNSVDPDIVAPGA